MKTTLARYWRIHSNGLINSYAQIFFSQNKVFAIVLLLLSLFDLRLGLGGLFAVLFTNAFAHTLSYSKWKIESGIYGFNAIFIGMSLVDKFHVNFSFFILFILAVTLGLMFCIGFDTIFAKHKIPFLTIPFVLTLFIVDLSYNTFTNISIIEPFDRYTVILASQMRAPWFSFSQILDDVQLPQILYYYLKTLSSIFFGNSILIGLIILLALFMHSRIKSTVAFLGFSCAFLCCKLLGVDIQILTQNLAGLNYIFWGMAIGSFFLVPNVYSYLLVLVFAPILFMVNTGIDVFLLSFGLSSYTLSFSIFCILSLFILGQRSEMRFFIFPFIQYYNPEKTVYKNVSYLQRFGQQLLFKLQLPFLDEWTVSQAYDGEHTHLGEWQHALDFVIEAEPGIPCTGFCNRNEDFFCFSKPVLAPADGYVCALDTSVEDNPIGEVDTVKNWGNSIVINHMNGLYTQLSHLRKESVKVGLGEFVTKGSIIASSGNSGRSAVPHLHYQVQLSPEIGAPTHPYPFAYYVEKQGDMRRLCVGETPSDGAIISNPLPSPLLQAAFSKMPGRKLRVKYNGEAFEWQIATDAYNLSYIYCEKTRSRAYIENDNLLFYFTDFEGKKSSPLYLFYRSCFKLLLSNEKNLQIQDSIPLSKEQLPLLRVFQDLLAPFVIFTKVDYRSKLQVIDNAYFASRASFLVETETSFLGIKHSREQIQLNVTVNQIEISTKTHELCIEYS